MKLLSRFPPGLPLVLVLAFAFAATAATACNDPLRALPDAAPQPTPVTHSLAAGASHTCALQKAGLFCWGSNQFGELGTGETGGLSGPVAAVAVGQDVVEVAANFEQTCVRRASGRVDCWGANEEGSLGDGTDVARVVPTPVVGIEDAAEIAAGGLSTCVRRRSGTVSCWGAAGFGFGSLVPVDVAGLADVVELRTSQPSSQYCARTGAGDVYCWTHADTQESKPALVPALTGTHALAVGLATRTCALTTANQILCDDGSATGRLIEKDVTDAVELTATALFVCWRTSGGEVGCDDPSGLIQGPAGDPRRDFHVDAPVVELADGQVHFCARVQDGGVECFNDPFPGTAGFAPRLIRVAGLPE
jgi:hypothetical protein